MTKEEAAKLVDYWTKKQIKDYGFKRGQLDNLKTQYGEDVYNQVVNAYKILANEIEEDNTTASVGGPAAFPPQPIGTVFKRKLPKMFEESWQNQKLPEFLDQKEAEVWIQMSDDPKKYEIKKVNHYSYRLQANRTFYQIVEK